MISQRRVLRVLSVFFILVSIFALARDQRFQTINCGSGLLPADLSELDVDSGDREADNFLVETYTSECAQRITLARFLAVIPLIAAIGCHMGAKQIERRRTLPGDPIV